MAELSTKWASVKLEVGEVEMGETADGPRRFER